MVSSSSSAGRGPRRVLVADDEPTLRLLVRMSILGVVDEVLEAEDGLLAWTLLREENLTLAILDVQMPGLTGLELTRLVRADARLADLPVILLTSKALRADLQAGQDAGATLYLTKPFSPLELSAALSQILK